MAYAALASAHFYRREFGAFRAAAERALELNRMEGYTTAFLGMHFAFSGDWERGCALSLRSTQLNPNHPGWYWLPIVLNAYRQNEADRGLELALRINMPGLWTVQVALTVIYSQLEQMDQAHTTLRALLDLRPDFGAIAQQELSKWWQPDLADQMLADLRKAGLDVSGSEASPPNASVTTSMRTTSGESKIR
jgi:tetratricopeptide (TPR) repeat protein